MPDSVPYNTTLVSELVELLQWLIRDFARVCKTGKLKMNLNKLMIVRRNGIDP